MLTFAGLAAHLVFAQVGSADARHHAPEGDAFVDDEAGDDGPAPDAGASAPEPAPEVPSEPASEPAPATSSAGTVQVWIEPLTIDGDESDDVQLTLDQALRDGLLRGDPGVRLALSRDAAAYVVRGQVTIVEREYSVELVLEAGDEAPADPTSAEPERVADSCEICGLSEAGEAVSRAAETLAGHLQARRETPPAPPRVLVASQPRGAEVYLDGVLVGATPVELTTTPGEHRVELRLEGHLPETHNMTLEPGDTKTLERALATAPRPVPFGAIGWSAVAVGAASLITGVVLLALDEQPYRAQCEGADVDALGRCRFRYNTLAGGVTGVAVGAALVGAGIGLVVHDARRRRSSVRAELRVGAHARGLSLSGRF